MTTRIRPETESGHWTQHISSIFLALGLIFFGVAAWRMQADTDPSTFTSLFAVFCGLGLLLRAVGGVQAGRMRIRRKTAERLDQPGTFWTAVVLFAVVGLVLAAAGVLRLLGVL